MSRDSKSRAEPNPLTVTPRKGKLPRGSHGLPKEQVQHEQRVRLIHGIARAIAEKGYAATTLSDIVAHSGVSRITFYTVFRDKEDCFLSGFKAASAHHLRLVKEASDSVSHPADKFCASVQAYVDFVDADRTFATAFIAEAERASAASEQAFGEVEAQIIQHIKSLLRLTQKLHPDVALPSALAFRLVVAGLKSFVKERAVLQARTKKSDIAEMVGFLFAGLGLYGWALQAKSGDRAWGEPNH